MKEQKIIHLEFKDKVIDGKNHYYFGSIAALFEMFGKEQLGISRNTLNNKESYSLPFENKHCIIREGRIHKKKTNRGEFAKKVTRLGKS